LTHIDASLAEQLRVADLARAVNLSPSRFTALFRAQTGVSPGQYLQAKRLEHARALIETTFLSVKQVMAIVGFNDPSHFTRAFARHHGLTPTQVRMSRLPVETADVA